MTGGISSNFRPPSPIVMAELFHHGNYDLVIQDGCFGLVIHNGLDGNVI